MTRRAMLLCGLLVLCDLVLAGCEQNDAARSGMGPWPRTRAGGPCYFRLRRKAAPCSSLLCVTDSSCRPVLPLQSTANKPAGRHPERTTNRAKESAPPRPAA